MDMKNLFKFFLFVMIFMMGGSTVLAQKGNKKKTRVNREELAIKQAKYITGEMALDDATATKFEEAYCSYQREVWALGPRGGKAAKRSGGITMEQRLEHSQKILDLRRKYYKIYQGFMTERQIDQAFKLEKRLMNRMMNRAHNKNKRR
mgnify:CR=1 FL=1